jgi:hypothetical protein
MAKRGERDPKRERFWRAAVQRREMSGLTARAFCRRERLSEASYYFWRRELARRDRQSQRHQRRREGKAGTTSHTAAKRPPVAKTPLFQELAIVNESPRSGPDRGLEIVLPDGCWLRVPAAVDCAWLASVLQAVEARRC